MFGFPSTYGFARNGYCGHCGADPSCHAVSAYGVFCLACCRWLAYCGPAQEWGDGMSNESSLRMRYDASKSEIIRLHRELAVARDLVEALVADHIHDPSDLRSPLINSAVSWLASQDLVHNGRRSPRRAAG